MTPHPAWLPPSAYQHLEGVALIGDDPVLTTIADDLSGVGIDVVSRGEARIVLELDPKWDCQPEAFRLEETNGVVHALAGDARGAVNAYFHLVRAGTASEAEGAAVTHSPFMALRMLDHWDNMEPHHVMGTVERGYAGDSLFFENGNVRANLSRVTEYARLLASIGVNRVAINNVNVHTREAHLLTDLLPSVVPVAEIFRAWAIRIHLSVSFASPVTLGGLPTSDPLDTAVVDWWQTTTDRVYEAIPDFGGFLVKADSEGQPGPFAYGRSHAEGANMLARALAPRGGLVHWRAFVYNHLQDWRDRTTDRARAAYDHFAPLDGDFDENVIVQIKHGPLDFQAREAISPVLAALPATRVALELQLTQEYTGQQRHACYLGPWWSWILSFPLAAAEDGTVADLAAGVVDDRSVPGGGIAGVANVGTSPFWTGHPLAQANLFAFGRLAWDPSLDPEIILDEWARLTFHDDDDAAALVRETLRDSWLTYESYTAPLGVGFMVTPGHHYGPSVDGYEYSPWGTYHFADREGIGVDRTTSSGTGFTSQYRTGLAQRYEDVATCPDDLLLFFHHVPYTHRLSSGTSVIQHIYDSHFEGVEEVRRQLDRWERATDMPERVGEGFYAEVLERLREQLRSATEWRDHVNSYFLRKSGIPDELGRTIY